MVYPFGGSMSESVTLPEIEAVRPEVADLVRAALHHGLDALDSLKTTEAVCLRNANEY